MTLKKAVHAEPASSKFETHNSRAMTALLVWFVLVSLVRALALTVFEVVTDFNAERGNVENGKV